MQIDLCAEIDPQEWDAAVMASDDAWLFHTSAWLEMTAEVWPVENLYVTARQNGRIVGGFPVQVDRLPGWLRWREAYSSRMGCSGPFVIREVAGKTRRRVLEALSEAVKAWARSERIDRLACALPPLAESNLRNLHGVNPLAFLAWEDVSTHTRIINLAKPESELWSDLSADARYNIRAAESAGYRVERAEWPAMLDEYYRVHVETYYRTGAQPHPKAYFQGIASRIAPAGNAVLWVCLDQEGSPVGFHNCGRFAGGAVYWSGCSRTEHLDRGVNYLLVWHALRGAKTDGCHAYDIGEVFPGASSGKLHGLSVFKSKFGGELYRLYRGELRFLAPWPRRVLRRALRVPAAIWRRIRKTVGKKT